MTRLAIIAAAALFAAPAIAGTYTATPAAPATASKVVARDIAWTYAGGTYTGRTAESRPLVLCQGLAKKVGQLNAFGSSTQGSVVIPGITFRKESTFAARS